MRLSKAIPRLRFERRRLYAQSKVCPPEMRRVTGMKIEYLYEHEAQENEA